MAVHLVTGGSGFVGSSISRLLIERGETVRILDTWRADDQPDEVEFIQPDITDAATVEHAMRGIDYVHHNAALVPLAKAGKRFHKVILGGTNIALRAALRADVRMFAFMSTSAVFGGLKTMPITNDTRRQAIKTYGRAKLLAESKALEARDEGLLVSIIRPHTVIGTGRLGIFEILFEWIRDGANIYVIGDGNNLFQFIHVDDLSEVSIQSCLQEKSGFFNVGTDRFGTLRQDLAALIRHAGTSSRIKSLPFGPTAFALTILDKLRLSPLGPFHYLTYHRPFYFDSSPIHDALGWRPKYGNQDMLIGAYDWFVNQYSESGASGGASLHRNPVKKGILKLVKAVSCPSSKHLGHLGLFLNGGSGSS